MPKKSIAYTITDDLFIEAVKTGTSIRDALLKMGLDGSGSAYRVFKKRVKLLELDLSHFTGQAHLRGKTHDWAPKIPLKKILRKNNGQPITHRIKARIIESGLLEHCCSECGLCSEWNGKPLTLQLDHINGDSTDHRISNLRLLCPNCHSQTETFAGKNKGKS